MITLVLVLFVIGVLFLIAAWMEASEPNADDIGKWSVEAIVGIVMLGISLALALAYAFFRVVT